MSFRKEINLIKINVITKCQWCQNEFQPRESGGSPQKFCGRDCKRLFEKSIRQWASNKYSKGTLKIDELQHMHSLETEKDER